MLFTKKLGEETVRPREEEGRGEEFCLGAGQVLPRGEGRQPRRSIGPRVHSSGTGTSGQALKHSYTSAGLLQRLLGKLLAMQIVCLNFSNLPNTFKKF